MSDDTPSPLDAAGIGGSAAVSEDDFGMIKTELQKLVRDGCNIIAGRRAAYQGVLQCEWEGQSFDGRKHRDDRDEEPFPFEGSSDARVRLADDVVRRLKLRAMAPLMSMNITAIVPGERRRMAVPLRDLATGLVGNLLAEEWRREWSRGFQYAYGDAPGGFVMGVYWEERTMLMERTYDVPMIAGLYDDPQDPGAFESALYANDAKAGAELLAALLPGVPPRHARQAWRDLQTTGSATIPVPEVVSRRPVITAHRLFRDIFFPGPTTDLQRARVIYRREWLTVAELRARVESHGYDAEAVEAACEKQGITWLPLTMEDLNLTGDARFTGYDGDAERFRGMVEVITAYYKAVSDDGVPAVYILPFHGSVETPFKDREILGYEHGEYPFVWYGSEELAETLWATRGVSEIVAADQTALKLHDDAYNDATTLATLPVKRMPANRPDMRWDVVPFGEVKEVRPGEFGFIPLPPPVMNESAVKRIRQRVFDYYGLRGGETDPSLIQLHEQGQVEDVLASARKVLRQMVALAIQYLPEDDLRDLSGDDTGEIATLSAGRLEYTLGLSFDARSSQLDWVKEMGTLVIQLLGIDNRGEVDRNILLQNLFAGLGPNFARAVKPADDAEKSEVDDEINAFKSIMSGVEPPMVRGGQNAAVRKNTLLSILQSNPPLQQRAQGQPDSAAMIRARLKNFDMQIEQERNAVIGRNGAAYALGNPPPNAA